ncbi:MAG: TIGR04222 domain-containing membrane protein [Rhodomicrobium sp.]
MPLNPLDWTAVPFLALYTLLAGAACWLCYYLRGHIGDRGLASPSLSPLELAYLAGGRARVGDALLAGLLSSDAATLTADGRTVDVTGALPGEMEPFSRLPLSGPMARRDFSNKIQPGVDSIRAKLQQLRLAPGDAQMLSHRLTVLLLLAGPLILGIAKVQVGEERHKPVGILAALIIFTVFFGIRMLSAPFRTRAGNEALEAQKAANQRAARAPLDNELMLAVALTGLVVLSGTPFESLYAASKAAGSGGCGGGGDGGGGGGGGCGGCGGGG